MSILLKSLSPEKDAVLVTISATALLQELWESRVWVNPRVFLKAAQAELACLAVQPDHRRAGAGERLVLAIEARAKQRKVKRLFVLTTRTAHWFIERGFNVEPVSVLPRRKQDLYNYQRRSQVLVKRL